MVVIWYSCLNITWHEHFWNSQSGEVPTVRLVSFQNVFSQDQQTDFSQPNFIQHQGHLHHPDDCFSDVNDAGGEGHRTNGHNVFDARAGIIPAL